MRTLGIDASSSSTGLVRQTNGVLIEKAVWKPSKQADKIKGAYRLFEYFTDLSAWVGLRRSEIDLAVIEELGMVRGAKTVRVLSHFEAISVVVCKRHGIPTVQIKAGVARNLVLGLNPNCSKPEVLEAVRSRYPEIKWSPVNQGGTDEADAFVLALAGPESL